MSNISKGNSEFILETEHVRKKFGSLEVLKDINLQVKKGEVICIIGPSGAGKSTYLRSLNQLEKITSGKIFINGDLFLHREHNKTVERISKEKYKKLLLEMGMCFQSFNLFPHKTVLENLMISPITVKKEKKEDAKKKALELLERVGLSEKANRILFHRKSCRCGKDHRADPRQQKKPRKCGGNPTQSQEKAHLPDGRFLTRGKIRILPFQGSQHTRAVYRRGRFRNDLV